NQCGRGYDPTIVVGSRVSTIFVGITRFSSSSWLRSDCPIEVVALVREDPEYTPTLRASVGAARDADEAYTREKEPAGTHEEHGETQHDHRPQTGRRGRHDVAAHDAVGRGLRGAPPRDDRRESGRDQLQRDRRRLR